MQQDPGNRRTDPDLRCRRGLLSVVATIVALTGCGEKGVVEPPPLNGIIKALRWGEREFKGGPVRLAFAPAGPFVATPLLTLTTPRRAAVRIGARLQLPGCTSLAALAGKARRVSGTLTLTLPESPPLTLEQVELRVRLQPAGAGLPRARVEIAGMVDGSRIDLALEGPVTTLDGRLVFQEGD